MTALEEHRKTWKGKTDEWLFERLNNELKQKVDEIHKLLDHQEQVKNVDVGSVVKSLHICKHCGVETFQPDEECHKAPKP